MVHMEAPRFEQAQYIQEEVKAGFCPGDGGREAGARGSKKPWRSSSSDLIKDVLEKEDASRNTKLRQDNAALMQGEERWARQRRVAAGC